MRRFFTCKLAILLAVAAFTVACSTTSTTPASSAKDAQDLVTKAQTTLANFQNDPDMTWFRDNVGKAKGILIAPAVYRAGFILGGSGGRAVLLVRDPKTGKWTGPAFYTLATGEIGLAAGVDVSEIIILAMTDKAVNSLMSTSFKLGGDVSIAAGPVGQGAKSTVTTDMISFARAKGLYAGLNLDGTVVKTSDEYNNAYYGSTNITPPDIVIRHTVNNPQAEPLRTAVAHVAGAK